MSEAKFDTLIHAPKRLEICALLAATSEMEFMAIREHINVSDSVLSKHIKLLEEADYLVLVKRPQGGRRRTWLSLSELGREAFESHVLELKRIVG